MRYNKNILSSAQLGILTKEDRKQQKLIEDFFTKPKQKKSKPKQNTQKQKDINKERGDKLSKNLTKNATKTEVIIKQLLDEKFIKYKFQEPITGHDKVFIVDFMILCEDNKFLVVEIDGNQHLAPDAKKYDRERTKWLKKRISCNVIRFMNKDVYRCPNIILKKIMSYNPLFRRMTRVIKQDKQPD